MLVFTITWSSTWNENCCKSFETLTIVLYTKTHYVHRRARKHIHTHTHTHFIQQLLSGIHSKGAPAFHTCLALKSGTERSHWDPCIYKQERPKRRSFESLKACISTHSTNFSIIIHFGNSNMSLNRCFSTIAVSKASSECECVLFEDTHWWRYLSQ